MIVRRSISNKAKPPEVVLPRPRREPLTREQITRLRYEDWRIAHDEGIPNALGRIERRSLSHIAMMYGMTPRAVAYGIQWARQARQRVYEALDAIASEPESACA